MGRVSYTNRGSGFLGTSSMISYGENGRPKEKKSYLEVNRDFINERKRLLKDFGIEVTPEILEKIKSCKNQIECEKYTTKLITEYLDKLD